MDWKLEVVVVPVTDVERSCAFYVDQLGFRLDTDHQGVTTTHRRWATTSDGRAGREAS